jgi:hypothetical protein
MKDSINERWVMKTARVKISSFISCDTLKRFIDEYRNFDAASRLCADYCVTADDFASLIDDNPKRKQKSDKLKSRLTFPAAEGVRLSLTGSS